MEMDETRLFKSEIWRMPAAMPMAMRHSRASRGEVSPWPPRSAHPVAAHREIGELLGAALREIAGDRLRPRHADDGAAARLGDDVVGDQRGAGAGHDRDGDADIGLAPHVAGDRDVAQMMPPA